MYIIQADQYIQQAREAHRSMSKMAREMEEDLTARGIKYTCIDDEIIIEAEPLSREQLRFLLHDRRP